MVRFAVLLALLAVGCAGIPEAADLGVAARAIEATAPDRPLRVIFRWRILDGQARFAGRGAARIEPPYRARLDLFGPNDEGYLSAALVAAEIRLRGHAEETLPPPAMVWSVLGVVRPPDDAVLRGTKWDDDGLAELRYTVGQGRLRYGLRDGRLRSVDWRGDRRMVVELEGNTEGLPAVAAYRDWSRNTELHIELESVEEVEPYPPEIWTLGR